MAGALAIRGGARPLTARAGVPVKKAPAKLATVRTTAAPKPAPSPLPAAAPAIVAAPAVTMTAAPPARTVITATENDMGLLSGIKKLGRAVDPTSSKSPLGGLTRTVINNVPGGSAALGAVGLAKAVTDRSKPTARATGTPTPPPVEAGPVASLAGAADSAKGWWSNVATKPATIAVAAVVVGGLVLLLFRRK